MTVHGRGLVILHQNEDIHHANWTATWRMTLFVCLYSMWGLNSSWGWWFHTWISHASGLSIFHQSYSSIIEAAHQPGPSPDRGRLIALVQPLLRGDDVHAPQSPVVPMGSVGILLHLKCVVLDVVDGGQDDAGVILLHPSQNGVSPERRREAEAKSKHLESHIA